MFLVITSPDVVAPGGVPRADVVQALRNLQASGNPTGVISNHPEPRWFAGVFGTEVKHLQVVGRQDGQIVKHNAALFKLQPHDTIVLAGKQEDVQMAKHGGAVLVGAGWCSAPQAQSLGIKVAGGAEFEALLNLISQWSGAWWFHGKRPRYSVRALSDLGKYNQPLPQQYFSTRVTALVKNGGPRLDALLAVTVRSLVISGFGSVDDLAWGVYPSSQSANDDKEVLSDFTHRLRTTVSQVRLAKRGQPLFIRHVSSSKRSTGGGGQVSRTDPREQVESIHLNPVYRKNLTGRNVVVVDDCTTYGLSFGVAAGFLRAAGANAVEGIALGKFGNQLNYFEIDIQADPFAPVPPGGYSTGVAQPFPGQTDHTAQNTLRTLIP
jgi:hypothetical protein